MQTWAAGNSQRSARAALASVPPTGSPLELFTPRSRSRRGSG